MPSGVMSHYGFAYYTGGDGCFTHIRFTAKTTSELLSIAKSYEWLPGCSGIETFYDYDHVSSWGREGGAR